MKPDPKVRKDGRCTVCRKPRVRPKTSYAKPEQFESDPFCSTECCRTFHGVTFSGFGLREEAA